MRGAPGPPAPDACVLLVVDVQHDACAPDGALGRRGLRLDAIHAAVDRSVGLADTARAAGVHSVRAHVGPVLDSTSIVQRWRPAAG